MKKWLRRIRGAVGIGLIWAAAWFGVGAMIGLVFFGATISLELFANALLFAVTGFVGGTAFSGFLGILEGRRTFDEMSLSRFAGWGAFGGLVVSGLLLSNGGPLTLTRVLVVVVATLLGAGSAAGSLALARRADPLLEAGESVDLLEEESSDPST